MERELNALKQQTGFIFVYHPRGKPIYIYGVWGYVQLIRVGFLPLLTLEEGMKIITGVYFTSV